MRNTKTFAVLLVLMATSCSELPNFSQPTPADLIKHSWWFDGRQVTVCGVASHTRESCTLEVCMDGAVTCPEPIEVWLSAKGCFLGDPMGRGTARVQGRFLDQKDFPKEPGLHDYVLAAGEMSFVTSCARSG